MLIVRYRPWLRPRNVNESKWRTGCISCSLALIETCLHVGARCMVMSRMIFLKIKRLIVWYSLWMRTWSHADTYSHSCHIDSLKADQKLPIASISDFEDIQFSRSSRHGIRVHPAFDGRIMRRARHEGLFDVEIDGHDTEMIREEVSSVVFLILVIVQDSVVSKCCAGRNSAQLHQLRSGTTIQVVPNMLSLKFDLWVCPCIPILNQTKAQLDGFRREPVGTLLSFNTSLTIHLSLLVELPHVCNDL